MDKSFHQSSLVTAVSKLCSTSLLAGPNWAMPLSKELHCSACAAQYNRRARRILQPSDENCS
jgi:hypothetical protein